MTGATLAPEAASVDAWSTALARSRAAHALNRTPLVELLEEELGCDSASFMAQLSDRLHIPLLPLDELRQCHPGFDLLPFPEAFRRHCVLVRDETDQLWLVLGDPFETAIQDWAEERLGSTFGYRLAHRRDIAAFLALQEESLRALDDAVTAVHVNDDAIAVGEDISIEAISGIESTVIRLVSSTLYDALKSEASDIHLETTAAGLTIKYRMDGVLAHIQSLPGSELAEQVISRIKVMSELDISERRVPQDGRFKARHKGQDIDFRVSVMPSVFGEDAVLRILDKRALTDQAQGLTFEQLGFAPDIIEKLRLLSAEPYGMFLVTGPTGSGKTTTLYAAITEINTGLDKIITIEDPVEYQLPGVLQIPVNENKGLSFARGLRSILRHDPDRIMVGEIRDSETAEIAVQSSLTGHLVYTTVHANNAFDVIGRFMHMGVDTYNLVSALNAVLAQRLVRVNCRQCSREDAPTDGLLRRSGLSPEAIAGWTFRRGLGCATCRGTCFKGRKAIAELVIMNDDLREMITAREPLRNLKQVARRAGTLSLRDAALHLVKTGETTLEEVNRVTLVA